MSSLSDSLLPLSPTLQPLVRAGGDPRAALSRLGQAGYGFVQLSATMPTMRPRELDRSARRDLRARLSRCGLRVAGVDLWIPPEHYLASAHCDRAIGAVLQAIELAADLGRVSLSLKLPPGLDDRALHAIRQQADTCSVSMADHGEADNDLDTGVDPAELLAADGPGPALVVCRSTRLIAARFSDSNGSQRVTPGTGLLDAEAYQVALLTARSLHAVVLDLRELVDPWTAAEQARSIWRATGLPDSRGV